ncbi:type I-B CRISPR-associated protein Cas5 [Romboutsia sp. CE17]|uniref:type I-B CRISPR-associated protein Cas5b n=1 Tax=Romboutsia sp. CE17 TaxID=2724150 RepID=UPI001442ACFB|nr:type I-B CRISPR-associated protein Cas5b [Romboutsia sp. CE17]QJA08404.1 type I-B CRISPR-associated protein Cas5 [Romboutsia sp. CE17]
MKVLKLKLFQETVCYKKPFAIKITETYPLPPYSTVSGLIHKVLGATEYIPLKISIQGSYESIFNNYQTTYFYKKDTITSMPMNSHMLLNVNLIIHIGAEEEVLKEIYDKLINFDEYLSLGRKEDLLRIDDMYFTEVEEFDIDEDNEEEYELTEFKIKRPIYIPKEKLEDKYVSGISYRLNNYYTNDTTKDKKRIWNKVDTYYVESGKNIKCGSILLDTDKNERDLVYFNI